MNSNEECDFSSHSKTHERKTIEIQKLDENLKVKLNEKAQYINDTSNEAIEMVNNWFQRLINDLIESQTQIIDSIQNERDRAHDELAKFDLNIHSNDTLTKLSNYQITKDIYLPDSRTIQPRFKISYEFKNLSSTEENWDLETNETTSIPLPFRVPLSTTSLFTSDTSQTFVIPKDEETDDFQWCEEFEEKNKTNSEYLLDPKLYHIGTSRHFPVAIHLVASNGTDLLCYSRESKQLIFINDGNLNQVILQWYHGHIIQLVWFDNIQSYVTITEDNQYEIYTIESTYNLRLKIRLRTCLPKYHQDILKDRIFLRTDDSHIFIYYQRMDGTQRLRLLNSTFECIQSYAIDQYFQKYSHDNGFVMGLCVNQEHVVLFVRLTIDDDVAVQAASHVGDIRLLVFNKSKMTLVHRIILPNKYFDLPFIVHFINLSSYFLIDQTEHLVRFFNYETEIGQIKLSLPKNSPIVNSITTMQSNTILQYSSIVLMNDGSLLISNNTNDLLQLILNNQSIDVDDW